MSDKDNVRPLPGAVSLDLDSAERDDARPLFVVTVGGRELTFGDPEEFDWQDLAEVDDPHGFLRHALGDEDRDFLYGLKLPGWKFGKLMEGYYRHYGLDAKLAQVRRDQQRRGF